MNKISERRNFIKSVIGSSGVLFLQPTIILSTLHSEIQVEAAEIFERRKLEADVLVAGGGMSGICAAIAAARNGAKVILIQNRSRLGGNASSEIRMHISGASQLKQVWRETGLLEELVLTEAVENPQRSYEMWDFILYNKVISEKNITLLLDTTLVEVGMNGNQINRATAICSPTEEIYEIKATYFADCTGDGTLAALAGADCMRGRESKSIWGESLAPELSDFKTMGNSLLFMASKHERKMPFFPPSWARKYNRKDFIHREITQWEYGYWWLELGGMEDTIKDGQKNRYDLLSVLFGVWDYIKNSGNHPESENWALSWVGMIPGKRESRRIKGEYTMTQQDIQHPKLFNDRVSYGGWPLDDHPPGGMNTTEITPYISIPLSAPYSIPFRALYSKDIGNLLMAGRNISVSHVALSSTRVMATCAGLGQAVGSAIGFCLENKITPHQLTSGNEYMKMFQQKLLRQDQPMLGITNEDDADLARQATITASSQASGGAAINIIDGYNRNINDGHSHQWQVEMKGNRPWIQLKWKRPVKINCIEITFDTGLQRFLRISPEDSVYYSQVRGPQPETVSDYVIEVMNNKSKMRLIEVKNNYLRKKKHVFEIMEADAIRLYIEKTNGDELARIFEVRCYLD